MEFISTYWWIWLIGFVFTGGFFILRTVLNMFGAASLAMKFASLSVEGAQIVSDKETTVGEKGTKVKDRALEEAANEVVAKTKGLVLGLAAAGAAWVFGILLTLSTILHIIDYVKA